MSVFLPRSPSKNPSSKKKLKEVNKNQSIQSSKSKRNHLEIETTEDKNRDQQLLNSKTRQMNYQLIKRKPDVNILNKTTKR